MQGELSTVLNTLRAQGPDTRATLLCICPNSEAVVRAAVSLFGSSGIPLLFVATLNQVDTDGGYTGWTPARLNDFVQSEIDSRSVTSPIFLCLDHGGPWKKKTHFTTFSSDDECMEAVKSSIRECLEADYSILHLDATGTHPDLQRRNSIPFLVERTIEMQTFAQGIAGSNVYFEVGTREDGLGDHAVSTFEGFLNRYFSAVGIGSLSPADFCVGDAGTSTIAGRANEYRMTRMSEIAASYNAFLKVHFSDDVQNKSAFPACAVGGANIGPGLSAVEYQALQDLSAQVDSAHGSTLTNAIVESLVETGYWDNLIGGPAPPDDHTSVDPKKIGYAARYVWCSPRVTETRHELRETAAATIDAGQFVQHRLEAYMREYIDAFRLQGLLTPS